MVEGGVVRFLARAGDWVRNFSSSNQTYNTEVDFDQTNIQLALSTMVDIPESTIVSLLKSVIQNHLSPPLETDSSFTPLPTLLDFLSIFINCPVTNATLIKEIKSQLTGIELIPILVIANEWLSWWAKNGGGGGEVEGGKAEGNWKEEGRKRPKRLGVNPFAVLLTDEKEAEDVCPPRMEDVSWFILTENAVLMKRDRFYHLFKIFLMLILLIFYYNDQLIPSSPLFRNKFKLIYYYRPIWIN